MSLVQLLTRASSTLSVPIGYALGFKEKSYQFDRLLGEIEEAKVFLANIKDFVSRLIDNTDAPLCALPAVVDAINAFQMFFFEYFVEANRTNASFAIAFPEWYRTELQAAVSDLLQHLWALQFELDDYLLLQSTASRSQSETTSARHNQCRQLHEALRDQEWDLCPHCQQRGASEHSTPVERFYREQTRKTPDYARLAARMRAFGRVAERTSAEPSAAPTETLARTQPPGGAPLEDDV